MKRKNTFQFPHFSKMSTMVTWTFWTRKTIHDLPTCKGVNHVNRTHFWLLFKGWNLHVVVLF